MLALNYSYIEPLLKADLNKTILYTAGILSIFRKIEKIFRHQGCIGGVKVTAVACRWQRVGDLIGSGFKLYTSRTRDRPLATCTIWAVFNQMLCIFCICFIFILILFIIIFLFIYLFIYLKKNAY